MRRNDLSTPLVYLKGVGPARADLLIQERGLETFEDLLYDFPFRYVDKSRVLTIQEARKEEYSVSIKGILRNKQVVGGGRKKRLHAKLVDGSGTLELIWFKGVSWVEKWLEEGRTYAAFGKITRYGSNYTMAHPELEIIEKDNPQTKVLDPVYSSTEKLDAKGLNAKGRRKLVKTLLEQLTETDIPEILPQEIVEQLRLCSRFEAINWIHFPIDDRQSNLARKRLKFEELFMVQIQLIMKKKQRERELAGHIFEPVKPD